MKKSKMLLLNQHYCLGKLSLEQLGAYLGQKTSGTRLSPVPDVLVEILYALTA